MVSHNNCPLCNSAEITYYLTCTDLLVSGEKFKLLKCRGCGFVFTDGYPEESDSGKYYESDDYVSHTDSGRNITDKTYRLVRKYTVRSKRRLVQKMTGLTVGNILDIGCGTGHFLNEMKQAGWNTKGIEMNQKAREYGMSRFNLEVESPDELSTYKKRQFDCITLWHVLEHLYDPHKWLKASRTLLKPTGKLIIAVPNCQSADAAHYSAGWAAYDVPRHIWHFNTSSMLLLSLSEGFRIKDVKRMPADVFYISILSEKHRGSGFPFAAGIIKGLFFSLASVFSREKSSSLLYILEI
jgi:2-polyprenyl-3-methyl-5-hydroxy-6-metoxy-1,4-benzoquinol methylase